MEAISGTAGGHAVATSGDDSRTFCKHFLVRAGRPRDSRDELPAPELAAVIGNMPEPEEGEIEGGGIVDGKRMANRDGPTAGEGTTGSMASCPETVT
jgi:hypothetical protein